MNAKMPLLTRLRNQPSFVKISTCRKRMLVFTVPRDSAARFREERQWERKGKKGEKEKGGRRKRRLRQWRF